MRTVSSFDGWDDIIGIRRANLKSLGGLGIVARIYAVSKIRLCCSADGNLPGRSYCPHTRFSEPGSLGCSSKGAKILAIGIGTVFLQAAAR